MEPEEIVALKTAMMGKAIAEIKEFDGVPIDHLRELVQAEQDGRLVVLPCKVGDTVYRIYDDCDFPGDCHAKRMCKGCEYRNLFIEEQAFCLSMLSQNGTLGHPYYLTREEAEAALKGGMAEMAMLYGTMDEIIDLCDDIPAGAEPPEKEEHNG